MRAAANVLLEDYTMSLEMKVNGVTEKKSFIFSNGARATLSETLDVVFVPFHLMYAKVEDEGFKTIKCAIMGCLDDSVSWK